MVWPQREGQTLWARGAPPGVEEGPAGLGREKAGGPSEGLIGAASAAGLTVIKLIFNQLLRCGFCL